MKASIGKVSYSQQELLKEDPGGERGEAMRKGSRTT